MNVDVKRAVKTAKEYVIEVFGDEGLSRASLEEVWHDDSHSEWCVTVGIRHRMIDRLGPSFLDRTIAPKEQREVADYKVVRVSSDTGEAISIKNRDDIAA